jgi:peroxiredoxin
MVSTIPCPGCSALLKRPAGLAAGKQIRCPQCQMTFVPEPGEGQTAVTTQAMPSGARPVLAASAAEPADPDAPRPPRQKATGSTGVVIGILAVVLVVLAGGLALAGFLGYRWLAVSKSTTAQASAAAPVVVPAPQAMQPVPGHGAPVVQAPAQPSPQVGEAAPEIEGKDLDGKPMKLSDFRGKVVVLDFWGDWCPFCKEAYSYQRSLVRRMEGRSFVLLGVNCDDTVEQARLVVKNQRISWRSWWSGPRDMTGPLYTRWGVRIVPSVFLIDRKGIVQGHIEGTPSEAALERAIDSLLPASERGRPRWVPPEEIVQQLSAEEEVGPYHMRLPPGFLGQHPRAEGKRQTFRWKHEAPRGGPSEQLEVVLAGGSKESPENAIETALKALPCFRQGWTCSVAERGEVNGLTFYRVNWVGLHQDNKRRMQGFVYAAQDGDTLIQVVGQVGGDTASMLLAEAAVLTLGKAGRK